MTIKDYKRATEELRWLGVERKLEEWRRCRHSVSYMMKHYVTIIGSDGAKRPPYEREIKDVVALSLLDKRWNPKTKEPR